jgi:hypothetical protein
MRVSEKYKNLSVTLSDNKSTCVCIKKDNNILNSPDDCIHMLQSSIYKDNLDIWWSKSINGERSCVTDFLFDCK